MLSYRYDKIGGLSPKYHSIRLLLLWPGKPEDPICCDIIEAPLDGIFAYEAVSYTWGDASLQRTIHVGGRDGPAIQVSANCFNVLNRLRQRPRNAVARSVRGRKRRTLWIDAVCINQQDVEERNAQVRLMGVIYSMATRVVVYLGECEDDAAHVVAQNRLESALTLRRPDPEAYDYLLDLLALPWFQRIWTLQEIVLAKKAVLIWCSEDFAWDAFRRLIRLHFGHEGLNLAPALHMSGHPQMQALELLQRTRGSAATDPRDKIFALQGMFSAEDTIPVNYSQPVEKVFLAFALNQILQGEGLLLMCHIQGSSAVPSWVPDWSVDSSRSILGHRANRFHAGYAPNQDIMSRQMLQVLDADPQSAALQMDVVILTAIEKLSGAFEADADEIRKIHDIVEHWKCFGGRQNWKASHMRSFTRTLCANFGKRQPGDYFEVCRAWHTSLKNLGAAPARLGGWDDRHAEAQYHHQVVKACHGRKLLSLGKSDYGLVPAEAEKGDVIAIPIGARVPFVLRPMQRSPDTTRAFTLVGECYVDGWMNGIMFDESEDYTVIKKSYQDKGVCRETIILY